MLKPEECSYCNGAGDDVRRVGESSYLCFSCAVSNGKSFTDLWLSDYINIEGE